MLRNGINSVGPRINREWLFVLQGNNTGWDCEERNGDAHRTSLVIAEGNCWFCRVSPSFFLAQTVDILIPKWFMKVFLL